MTASTATSGPAGRYASALFELARERSAIAELENDVATIERAVAESPDLSRSLTSPIVRRDEHAATVAALAQRLGLGALTTSFLGVLAQQRRLGSLPMILASLRRMLAEERGESAAEVVSAVPLDQGQLDQLKDSVARHVGRAVELTASVDPSLIGGLVVRIGSRMIDASLKTKLQQLELSMRGIR